MKKMIFTLLLMTGMVIMLYAQNTRIEMPIRATGGQVNDTLDDGTVVTLNLSSDDAEQENDEVDTPYDDDLDAGWEGAADDQNVLTMGLRFRDLPIPQGATIDSAFVYMHTHEGKTAEDVAEITIVGEDTDSAATFDEANFNEDYLLTDRTETSASVQWIVDEDWVIWTEYRTPDIKDVVQEIVDRSGWKYGNALALILKGEDQGPSDFENAREFEAFENIADPEDEFPDGTPGDGKNHPERVPRLVVYYTAEQKSLEMPIQATGGQVNDTLDDGTVVTLDLSSDDAEQENDEVDTPYDDDLDAGWEGAADDQNVLTMGLRFRDIAIPNGAVIDSAFVYLYTHEGKTADDVAEITIVGENADHAPTFDEEHFNADYLLTDRPATSASVDWTVAEDWIIWTEYRTPDVKAIIQEIVNRNAWNYGNALALIFKGKDQGPSDYENAREFEAFENIADPEDEFPDGTPGDGRNHPERVPRIMVYYSYPDSINYVPEKYASDAEDDESSDDSDDSDNDNSDDDATAIEKPSDRNDLLKVYPNPSRDGNVFISLHGSLKDVSALVTFYNLTGKVVKQLELRHLENQEIHVGDLSKGIYLLQINQGSNVYTKKLILQK